MLSAEHGLVAPDEVLAPYDLRLSKTSRDYRRAWGARVVERLGEVVGPLSGKTVEVHAGSAYTDSIRDLLIREGATVVEPLAGLRMGARLAWYGNRRRAPLRIRLAARLEVRELIDRLTADAAAITPEEFLATGGAGLDPRASTAGGWTRRVQPTLPRARATVDRD